MPAPTFQNLGFEAAGPTPGSALGWLLAWQATAEEIASFGPSPVRPHEDFERGWLGNEDFLFAFAPTSVEPALFDPASESAEDFEEGWSQNESFLFEFASVAAADYEPGRRARRAYCAGAPRRSCRALGCICASTWSSI
jgi:hypothetical protein